MSPINTHEYDLKGRCVRHPTTRLRKKKFFRGWKILLKHCKDCAVAAFKENQKDLMASDSDCSRTAATESTSSDERSAHDFFMPSCPSPEKSRTKTRSRPEKSQKKPNSRRTVVCGVRYTDPQNQTRRAGSYTGEVKVGTCIPDGLGTLRYKDGSIAEGKWRKGEIVAERELSFKCVKALSSIQEGPISSTNPKPVIKSSQSDNISVYFNKQSGSASDNIQSHRYRQRTRFSATRSVCTYDSEASAVRSSQTSCSTKRSTRSSRSSCSAQSMDPPGWNESAAAMNRRKLSTERRNRN